MAAKRYLLDTNVISEMNRKRPEPLVAQLLLRIPPSQVFLSVVTIAELRKGASSIRHREKARSTALTAWIDSLEDKDFAEQILGIDLEVARVWGHLCGQRTRPVIDTFLAATAIVHGLTMVTRNVTDFRDVPVDVLNPWHPEN